MELEISTVKLLEVVSLFLGFAIVLLLGVIAYRHVKGIK